jgi:hypothetical protein
MHRTSAGLLVLVLILMFSLCALAQCPTGTYLQFVPPPPPCEDTTEIVADMEVPLYCVDFAVHPDSVSRSCIYFNVCESCCATCNGTCPAPPGPVCTACPANTVSAITTCICNVGIFSGPNGAGCTACPLGKYTKVAGSGICTNYSAGAYSDAAGGTCTACGPGKYSVVSTPYRISINDTDPLRSIFSYRASDRTMTYDEHTLYDSRVSSEQYPTTNTTLKSILYYNHGDQVVIKFDVSGPVDENTRYYRFTLYRVRADVTEIPMDENVGILNTDTGFYRQFSWFMWDNELRDWRAYHIDSSYYYTIAGTYEDPLLYTLETGFNYMICCRTNVECDAPLWIYVNNPIQDSVGPCTNCPANSSSPISSSAITDCACDVGFTGGCGVDTTCPSGNVCMTCVAGTYKNSTGSGTCTVCVLGKYGILVGATDESVCVACGAGRYTLTSGQSSSVGCKRCASGKYVTTAVNVLTDCIDCPIGTFSPVSGSTECELCAVGRYGNTVGRFICTACKIGTYTPVTGSSSCTDCAAGKYGTLTQQSAEASCTACPAGLTSPNASTSIADCRNASAVCNAGYTGPDGGPCSACDAGTYKNVSGSVVCTVCPSNGMESGGTYSDSAGATGCTNCPVNTVSASIHSSTYCICAKGYTVQLE